MAYTVSQVRNSNPDVLVTAGTDAGTSAKRVGDQVAGGQQQFTDLAEDWSGEASRAAQKQYGELVVDQKAYQTALLDAKDVLDARGPELVRFRSELDCAVDGAEMWWNVADNGSVSPGVVLSAYASLSDVHYLHIEAQRLDIENNIKLLLAQFEAEDAAAAYELRQIGRELE